jgi:hypothetical protein
VLPKTPGVEGAPNAEADEGKKLEWPRPELFRFPPNMEDWFPKEES